MNLAQSRGSFRMGVFAFLAGLTMIGAGIATYYAHPQGGVSIAAVSVAGGALGSFISGSCFAIYRRAMTQADYFYANLARAQETLIAVSLCDGIADPEAHTETIRDLIHALLERPAVKRPAASRTRSLSRRTAPVGQNGPAAERDDAPTGGQNASWEFMPHG